MYSTSTQGENRSSVTPGDPFAEHFNVPLLRLRGHYRQVIQPQDCRVPGCLVCQWRRAGLLDAPVTRVVREPASGYACTTSWCPGCNALRCICPPEDFEEVVYARDYALGRDHGTADGPDNRPTRRWCTDPGLYADAYLEGYEAGCNGVPLVEVDSVLVQLWDEIDDGLPF